MVKKEIRYKLTLTGEEAYRIEVALGILTQNFCEITEEDCKQCPLQDYCCDTAYELLQNLLNGSDYDENVEIED